MSESNKDEQYQDKHQFWQAHVEAWERSGIRQAEYCRHNGLNIKIFGYWKRKLCRKTGALSFVPVSIKGSGVQIDKSDASLRLMLRGDMCIEIGDCFNPETLRRLLNTLAGGI